MATLDELESRLQALVEVHLLKLLPGYKVEDGIAQQLAAAMHAGVQSEAGATRAPNLYGIVAHPFTLSNWQAKPQLLEELANALYIVGSEAGFLFSTKPTVTTTADANMPLNELHIVASFSNDNVAETQGLDPEAIADPTAGTIPSNAFLIVDGTQVVPLNRSVINIGRRLDNHVVIDDPRVSRVHAQLRNVKDRFVIFDLNSSGGTFVNGRRTNQSILYPGDVISLAGVSIIFGQDLPAKYLRNEGQTRPAVPASANRSTVILRKDNDLSK